MNSPASDEQITALTEELRQAAGTVSNSGWWFMTAANVTVLLVVGARYLFGVELSLWLLPVQWGGLLAWYLARTRMASLQRRRLRQAVAALPPAEQRRVLLPLVAEKGPGTKKLVGPWLRDLPLRALEATPSDALPSRGDEPVPAP